MAIMLACGALAAEGQAVAATASSATPPPRAYIGMAYDAARGNVVLFGGWNGVGYLADTWTWDGATWAPQASNLPRTQGKRRHGLRPGSRGGRPVRRMERIGSAGRHVDVGRHDVDAADPLDISIGQVRPSDGVRPAPGVLVLFGGQGLSGILGDTWTWNGTNWHLEQPPTSPDARSLVGMADYGLTRVVIFDGWDGFLTYHRQTWAWDGATWAMARRPPRPSGRASVGMAFDAARGEIVMFGGTHGTGVRLDDTWTWSRVWEQHPAVSPSERDGMGMAYDEAHQVVVLFGGYHPGVLGDTWTWDGALWTLAAAG